jgi:hypothetical protein
MTDSEQSSANLPKRLCSEIQLFELCELDSCNKKSGGFCTDTTLINRFEMIEEAEDRVPERYISEELDDAELDEDDYEEDAMEGIEAGEDDDWEDEE